MFVPDVIHCEGIPDNNDKLPDASILNWAGLIFNVIVFVVLKNGFEKVKLFCFVLIISFNYVSIFVFNG
jgi:hypothetical protein